MVRLRSPTRLEAGGRQSLQRGGSLVLRVSHATCYNGGNPTPLRVRSSVTVGHCPPNGLLTATQWLDLSGLPWEPPATRCLQKVKGYSCWYSRF
ncbi:hypothetical protein LC593_24105 [Nostoc sp. CHAB 5844]|nr:hypothetical protein [Nostoc sp. CHAB 5844]